MTVLLKEHECCRLFVRKQEKDAPRWIEMPSIPDNHTSNGVDVGQNYHDLGEIYSDAPVSRGKGDVIVHRAILDDITGIPEILNWVSDGDVVIIEMSRLMTAETELKIAIERIQVFVEEDLSGMVVRLGQSRLLLLPSEFAVADRTVSRF